jgi:energy-coupling factor transport system ATP-binding protein
MEPEAVRRKVNKVLTAFDIESLVAREPSALSGGERAMVALASVVVAEPRYLVLDEPTSLLDAKGRRLFHSMLRILIERGLGVILLTQYADEALLSERLVVLEKGRKTYDGGSESLLLDGDPEAYGFWMPSMRRAAERLGVWHEVRRAPELSRCLARAGDIG